MVLLLHRAGLTGLPHDRRRGKRTPPEITITDLVKQNHARNEPNHPSVTVSPDHPIREGQLFFRDVLDMYSRLVFGWAIALH